MYALVTSFEKTLKTDITALSSNEFETNFVTEFLRRFKAFFNRIITIYLLTKYEEITV